MESYQVRPVFCPSSDDYIGPAFELKTSVPGSKSITNRALMLAALSDGETVLEGILLSDDSRHFIQCLTDLGFSLKLDEAARRISIRGTGGRIPLDNVGINVGSAGTAARFLTAMLGCSKGTWHLDASEQMKRRPMAPLLKALGELGCGFDFEEKEWAFPFTVHANGIQSGEVCIDIEGSSQYLSALLMSAAAVGHSLTIHTSGLHGLSYVKMTLKLMESFGAKVAQGTPGAHDFTVNGASQPRCGTYSIEADVSAASYFYAMAAISGGKVLVRNIHPDSVQGDIAFIDLLVKMGCHAEETAEGISLSGPENGCLCGIDADMGSFSDQALTLAAIAPFADSPVTIRGISHIRLQECDRIQAILVNMERMGIHAGCSASDEITIMPGMPKGALIKTFGDHRVAMSFALTGLRAPGIIIEDPQCCRKTFAEYFDMLDEICSRH